MIGHVKHFDSSKTMSLKANDNRLYTKMWERGSNLMNIKFDSEPVYIDNDKYVKTKIKSCRKSEYTFSRQKSAKRKCFIQVLAIDNIFCYQSKQKVLSSNTIGGRQI